MEEQKVAVLMATFNGGKFLKQQLDSINNQKHVKFDLFVSDDNLFCRAII